ncbi:MAG: methyl-accepting chemotaxis protein [Bacteroidota bacterium]
MMKKELFSKMRSGSIRFKLFASQNTLNALLFVIIVFLIYSTVNTQLNRYFDTTIRKQAQYIKDELDRLQKRALEAGEWFEYSARLHEALRNNDRQAALELGKTAMQAFGLHYFVVTDIDGNVLVRAHAPDNFGDNISNQRNVQLSLQGRKSAGIEEGRVVRLSIRAGTPLRDDTGKIIGAISTGYVFDDTRFVDDIKRAIDSEVTIFMGSTRYQTTITNESGQRIVGTDLGNPEIENQVLNQRRIYYGNSQIQGQPYKAAYMPLTDLNNEVIGMLFCGTSMQVINVLNRNVILNVAVIFILVIVVITLVLTYIINKSVIKPITGLVTASEKIANGDLNVKIDVRSNDEVGRLASAQNKMIQSLRNIVQQVIDISGYMSTASQQMSSTAQQISQGANDQASSVEEVSSSMEEMSSNIAQNTDNAKGTEKTALHSVEAVKEGNRSTLEAAKSMKEIAEKISIISEIASQTNLLALNAAVEAARAGEHGKGFAVVAAEVRKLAERSHVAAEEINTLSDSGLGISEKAGAMLQKIVPEIERTATMVQEIAAASIEQNTGAEQINNALASLNRITQQNASASEELASSSEELSAQAEQLKEMTAFFRL